MKIIDKISDVEARNAKAKEKPYKLPDGRGLSLLITPGGSKLWRLKFYFEGKEQLLSLGEYPEVPIRGLKDKHGNWIPGARDKAEDARRQIAAGINPCEIKREAKAKRQLKAEETRQQAVDEEHTLEAAAEAFITFKETTQDAKRRWDNSTAKMRRRFIQKDVPDDVQRLPVYDISADLIEERIIIPLLQRGVVTTANRMRVLLRQIFEYARTRLKWCSINPIHNLPAEAIPIPTIKNRPAILEPSIVGGLLRAIDSYEGSYIVKMALQLHPLTVVRPGELRHMEWVEIDFDRALWTIPGIKMKTRNDHLVPLCKQAVKILRDVQKLTGSGKYVFPSIRSAARPMSNNTLNAALRRLGFTSEEVCSHGWRSTFRTLADERLRLPVDLIEFSLAHAVRDALGTAYNRAKYLEQRRELMETWSHYLEGLRGGKIISFPLAAGG